MTILISVTLPSMDIGMQIIHFKKFCVPVATVTSKVDKLLKMPSDSISEGVISQNFLGGMPPCPPSVGGHAPMPPWCWYALHACVFHTL